ncbi:hypothetical protein L2E82_25002 [Cichorium intybus]|uniref:Uncharacterized protein n=1 Tax=Cichorium intybus TaxID=13427 RepID=A0ACB9E217_CICIN|nr:hypothetical protein L2E82_25002 [Cichorium intybus]
MLRSVLGGVLTPGSLVLISDDPDVGKRTLMLQVFTINCYCLRPASFNIQPPVVNPLRTTKNTKPQIISVYSEAYDLDLIWLIKRRILLQFLMSAAFDQVKLLKTEF